MKEEKVIKLIAEAHTALTKFNPDFAPSVHHIQDYIDNLPKGYKKKDTRKESRSRCPS